MNKFENDIYPIVLWITTDKNDKDIKTLKDSNSDYEVNLDDSEDGLTQSVTDGVYYNGVLIYLNKNKSRIELTSIIVHECIHALDMFCNMLGMSFDYGNDEHAAYLAEWIGKCCEECLEKS
jgi:hypothetical protein